jgi:hypothetical protein
MSSSSPRPTRRGTACSGAAANCCIWVYVPDPPPTQTDARLSRAAASLGGYLDGGNTRLRILTVPVSAGFARVETELDAAVAELGGSSWAYGNVYDRQDRPLGWWEARA